MYSDWVFYKAFFKDTASQMDVFLVNLCKDLLRVHAFQMSVAFSFENLTEAGRRRTCGGWGGTRKETMPLLIEN